MVDVLQSLCLMGTYLRVNYASHFIIIVDITCNFYTCFFSFAVFTFHVVLAIYLCAVFIFSSVQIAVLWWERGTVKSSVSTLRVTVLSDLFTVKLCLVDPSAP